MPVAETPEERARIRDRVVRRDPALDGATTYFHKNGSPATPWSQKFKKPKKKKKPTPRR